MVCFGAILRILQFMPGINLPHTDTVAPDFVVLEALKQTCESIRRHNPSMEVARAALDWEKRFVRDLGKLQPEAQADAAEAA